MRDWLLVFMRRKMKKMVVARMDYGAASEGNDISLISIYEGT